MRCKPMDRQSGDGAGRAGELSKAQRVIMPGKHQQEMSL